MVHASSPVVLAFFGAPMEMLVVAGVVLLLFGNRLPGMMRSLGRSVTEFKKGINEEDESGDPDKLEKPRKEPLSEER